MPNSNKYKMKSESKSKTERILYGIVVTTAVIVMTMCIYSGLME